MLLRKNKVSQAVMMVIGSRDDYNKSVAAIYFGTLRLTQAADSLGYVFGSPMALKGLNVLCH